MHLYEIGLLLLGAVSPALPPFFVKHAILDKSIFWYWIVASIFCYLLLIYIYWLIFSDKRINVMLVYFVIKILSILVALFIGMTWFNYTLNKESLVGILFGIISIALLSKNIGSV
jgi:multidrug transporter EmrE-like cation transporter